MAKRVQLPDGSIGEFPDNMDDAAIEGVLRKQFAPAPAPTWADRGREALQGAKSSFDRAALGIKGLLPQSVQDAGDWVDQKMGSGGLNKQTAVQAPDTWAGTAGSIAGDIAMTAAPSGRIAQVASALPRALNFGRGAAALTNAATQIGGNAAMSAAIAPEDRGMAAGAGAIGAGVGMGLQRAMGGLVRPLVTDDAQNMIRRGVNLTPGQAMGGAWNEAEQRMTSLPFAGHFIGSGRQRAYDQAFRGMADDVVRDLPGMLPPQATGTAVALRPNNAVARAGALPRATAAAGPATPQVGREAVGKAAPGNDAMITCQRRGVGSSCSPVAVGCFHAELLFTPGSQIGR